MKAHALKVCHHGVTGIAPNTFFDNVNPEIALFPMPFVLWRNPRADQARNWVVENNVKHCTNGHNGHVILEFFQDSYNISSTKNIAGVDCPIGSNRWEKRTFKADRNIIASAIQIVGSILMFDD